jgi:4'-phosphopantetheinyl transferase
VTQAGEVGIDVERIKPCEDFERIAERFFSPPEVQALRAIPPKFRPFAFLAYWTRKEAFTKALGAGLQMDWTSFAVSLLPAQTVQSANPSGTRWSIFSFLPALGYVAALACQGDAPTLKFWKWSPVPSLAPSPQFPGTGLPAGSLAMPSVSREEVCV